MGMNIPEEMRDRRSDKYIDELIKQIRNDAIDECIKELENSQDQIKLKNLKG